VLLHFNVNRACKLTLCIEPQQVKETLELKDYNVFRKHFAALSHTLTDMDNLYPLLISKGIVTTEDVDEIKFKPRQSDRVCQFLKYIEGPLSANNAENFYTLLDD